METKLWPRVLAGLSALVVVAGVAVVLLWERADHEPAPDVAASTIGEEDLARASTVNLFFGHMSVGNNVLQGIERVFTQKGLAQPEILQVEPGDPAPQLGEGVFVHALIGENRDPLGKLANFDAALRSGLAGQVDVALLKFCYLDITQETDVEALFAQYKQTLDALERDFPEVRFLHATSPLTTAPSGIKETLKAILRGEDNPARERYNALVRASYGPDALFDIAAAEATSPDGARAASLYPGYSSDGSHLNGSGSSLAAVQLLRLLAQSSAA